MWCAALAASAATCYVNLDNPNPVPPYTNWVTAATNIQDAVDAAVAGDLILVTNGLYQTGARAVYGMSNRLAVTKPVTVQSLNGPGLTAIVGFQVPGTTNGAAAVRCVYLTSGAVLAGFTLTNGATQTSGDPYKNQSGGGVWCESASASAVVSNCTLTGNSAYYQGGGAYGGTLNTCTLTGNSASAYGGGAYSATLNNCTVTTNSASYSGGGAYYGTLNNCTLAGNLASQSGGGAYSGTLNNCTLTGNSAAQDGGGASDATLNNCTLTGNSAQRAGGGAYGGTFNNCTLTGNSAQNAGGGAYGGTFNNCIVYYNTGRFGGDNYYGGTLSYCCTIPLPGGGSGNFNAEPQLAGNWHLSATSPCRGAGNAAYAGGLDLDGEPWASPPSVGCDEYWSGSATGAVSLAIQAAYTNVAAGFAVNFQGLIGGRLSASRWDFGDGVVVSNRPYATHAWSAAGDYVVELRAYNESYPGGVAATLTVHVVERPVHYVALNSTTPVAPYSSWATAATNIQAAVDAAVPGALVLVSNGVYQAGAVAVYGMSNRVAVTKPVTVQSLNGPELTAIVGCQVPGTTNGAAAVRCVYLTNGAALAGFTLTNGATQTSGDSIMNRSGGGVWGEPASAVVSNCTLSGNSAYYEGGGAFLATLNNCTLTGNSAQYGGGAYSGTLNNCTLTGNSASMYGGGASFGTLNNCTLTGNSAASSGGGAYYDRLNSCTLTGNSASSGGGAYSGTLNNCTLTGNSAFSSGGGTFYGTLNNCIVYYNTAGTGPNHTNATVNYSCTSPLPAGPGNIGSDPLFVNTNGWSNLRLQSNSPCINAGTNSYVSSALDLYGQPRISGGTVDMGAYEVQILDAFHTWLAQYGLPTDGSADYADSDLDGMNNWQEWRAGTNPTDAASVLRMLSAKPGVSGVTVTWSSVPTCTYSVELAIDPGVTPAFSLVQSNIAGLPGTTSWTDTNTTGSRCFYRVRVEP